MILIKTPQEIELMKRGGKILGKILRTVADSVKPGVTTQELDELAEKLIIQAGGRPAFKNYRNFTNEPAFPTTLCTSINEEIVHGAAIPSRTLLAGDLISLDIGMQYPAKGGCYTDTAVTVIAGKIDPLQRKLLKVTKRSLELGIAQAKPGNCISDIGRAIQEYAEKQGFAVIRDLVGHGVGREVHEDPPVYNFVFAGQPRVVLEPGMTIAIEPMIVVGRHRTRTLEDGWTVITADRQLSAHFEHTIVITEKGNEVIT